MPASVELAGCLLKPPGPKHERSPTIWIQIIREGVIPGINSRVSV